MKHAFTLALAAAMAAPALGNPLPAPRTGMQRWIVTFKPKVKRAGRDADLQALNLKAVAHIASDGDSDNEFSAAVVDLPAGQTLTKPQLQAAGESASDDIVAIEQDRRLKWIEQAPASFQATPFGLPSGAVKFPRPGQFPAEGPRVTLAAARPEITWGIDRVHAPAAWDTTEGADVKVAIIDTGIDFNHPDLIGKVDGGYSAITKTEKSLDYQDDNGHGTHVSGTVAAQRDGRGVVGVAPKARLYAVKVLDADGSGTLSDVVDGIVWAAKNGMQVANMSLGAGIDSDAVHRAVRYAKGSGVVVVAAAGNTGGPVSYPGAYPETIAVAASDSDDQLAAFSSRGPEVNFIAPGVDVVSDRLGGGLISYSGTSMATPHVAGLAALAISQGWTGLSGPDGVLAQLKRAARPLPGVAPEGQGCSSAEQTSGCGMINAGRLVH